NITASASGASSSNDGIYSQNDSPNMNGVTASASGGIYARGVHMLGASPNSPPRLTNVTASASGGSNNYGVWLENNVPAVLTGVTAKASGQGSQNYGMYIQTSRSEEHTSELQSRGHLV